MFTTHSKVNSKSVQPSSSIYSLVYLLTTARDAVLITLVVGGGSARSGFPSTVLQGTGTSASASHTHTHALDLSVCMASASKIECHAVGTSTSRTHPRARACTHTHTLSVHSHTHILSMWDTNMKAQSTPGCGRFDALLLYCMCSRRT